MTQFHRPRGRMEDIWCDGVSDDLQPNYDALLSAGLRITAEVLTTGQVSLALEHKHGDFDGEIVRNEPEAPLHALEKLIRRFNTENLAQWLTQREAA